MSSKAKKMEQLSSMIVQSLAASIQNLDPIDEICDMLVESSGYRKALYAWRDQHTGLNLLQLAVVSKHLDVVKMFCLEKHKGSFRQTWHGEYYNPLLHLACKVGALNIIRYLVEQQNADMTAEGVVTYPHPTDSNTLSQTNSPVFNSGEIHVFMSRSDRNYLRLQGDHEHDISYGAGHSSFLSDDKDPTSCRNKDQPQITSQLPMRCLAGPSTSYSSHQSSQRYSEAPIADTSAKLERLSVGKNSNLISSEDSQLKEAKQITGQTPYQICVSEGHAVCANYLCVLIISRMEKPIYRIHNSPLLHKVSYLGCAQHLQLLLKHGHQRHINDKDHQSHMPIHIASLTANPECIEVLLKHGASVNSRADHRTCLQIMYWSKFRPENFVLCSEILVRYGMDVNAMDHNNNTALDYLAWELGQKWYQISKAWVKTHRIAEINNYLQPAAHLQEHILSDDQFRQEIFCCMQVLLAAGASTLVISRDGRVDHTIVHTLLQNTGWPLNSSLRKRPMEVYKALDLFFHYGADPNVIARNNNESAMTMLLMHSLHEIPNNLKVKFVALFLMNGANLECLIPEPKQYRENYSDRRWNIYPVMVGLQERHQIDVVKLLYDFMSLRHVYRSLRMTEDKFLWHRMTWSLGGEAKDCKYREQWLAIRIPRVRTLRHCCKISVFKAVGRRAVLIDELPLPRPLKRYLHDTDS